MRLALITWFCWTLSAVPAAARDGDEPSDPIDFAIVVTGGELLAGAYADGHTRFLASTLRPLGLRCVVSVGVDDRPADIQDALHFASQRSSLVIVTGGLGPTDNDLTRETLAEFTGLALVENTDVLKGMSQRLRSSVNRLPANLRRQAMVPARGGFLKNPHGTAVGLVFESDDATIVALPGPPSELRPMVLEQLVPYLSRKYGTRTTGSALTVRFVGLGQSRIDQTLEEHVELPEGVTVGSDFDGGRVDFTFALPDNSLQARTRLQSLQDDILACLGQYIYSVDARISLEQRVVMLLREQQATLSIAEAGTSGVLSAGLVGADPTGDVVLGVSLAVNPRSLSRLVGVSQERWSACESDAARTELLTSAVQTGTGSQWGLAIGSPQDERSVPVALRNADGFLETQLLPWRGATLDGRRRLATQVLDLLRRRLQRDVDTESAAGT